jgi:hypothetical protein
MLFVGSLSCITPQEYQSRILQHNQLAADFCTLNNKKDKIKNIDDRLAILSSIVNEAVNDRVFKVDYKDNVIDKVSDIAEPNPLSAINNQALLPFQNSRILSESITVKSVFCHNRLTSAKLTTLFKELRLTREELLKVSWSEACQNKYNETMKPFFKKSALWTSLGFGAIVASKIFYKYYLDFNLEKESLVKALTVNNAAYLLATLAIISNYLGK